MVKHIFNFYAVTIKNRVSVATDINTLFCSLGTNNFLLLLELQKN